MSATDRTNTHERQVLGAMLTSASAIDNAQQIVTADQFREPRHEMIFDAITAQADANQPTDVVAVADRLGDDLDRCGGHLYLHELVSGLISAASAEWNAEKVRDASTVRRVRSIGQELMTIAETDSEVGEIVDQARATLDGLARFDAGDESHDDAILDALAALDQPHGIKTPWRSLTDGINGWAPGMLYVVGARPGIGKTVFGIEVLIDIARKGERAVMVSLEMPKVELYHRMLSNVGRVDSERIQHRAIFDDDRDKLTAAAATIGGWRVDVDDRSGLSIAQIRAKVRTLQRSSAVGVVVVDYLGLVKPPRDAPRNDRRVQVDAIAQGLKDMARDLRVPVVALAQLNRGIEGRADKMPTLSDLRESGGIEAAADVVILMHRDIRESPERLDVAVAKNRHGPQTFFHLDFNGTYSEISEPRWTPTGATA